MPRKTSSNHRVRTVALPHETWQKLKIISAAEDRKMRDVIIDAVDAQYTKVKLPKVGT